MTTHKILFTRDDIEKIIKQGEFKFKDKECDLIIEIMDLR